MKTINDPRKLLELLIEEMRTARPTIRIPALWELVTENILDGCNGLDLDLWLPLMESVLADDRVRVSAALGQFIAELLADLGDRGARGAIPQTQLLICALNALGKWSDLSFDRKTCRLQGQIRSKRQLIAVSVRLPRTDLEKCHFSNTALDG